MTLQASASVRHGARRSTRSGRCRCASALFLALLAVPGAALADPSDPAAPASDAVKSATPGITTSDAQMPSGSDMPGAMAATPGGLTLSLGGSGWSGKFGFANRTTISAATVDARFRRGDVFLSGSVPYEQVISDSAIFPGIDGTPLVAAPSAAAFGIARRRYGLGDLTLGVGATVLHEDSAGVDLSVAARVKLPTASNDQLSTRRTDASFRVEASKTFGRVAPIAMLSYRTFGDTAQWRLRDGVAGSVGASYIVGRGTVILLTYDYAERTSAYIGPANAVVLGASRPLGERLRLTGFASAGLSSGAAGVSAGVSIGYRFG